MNDHGLLYILYIVGHGMMYNLVKISIKYCYYLMLGVRCQIISDGTHFLGWHFQT